MDVVLEMSGVPCAIHQAFALVRPAGRVQMLGVPAKPMTFDFATELVFKGVTVYGVTGRRMYDTWHQMTRFLRSGQFDPTPVITHRFPLEQRRRGDRRDQDRRRRQSHLRHRVSTMNDEFLDASLQSQLRSSSSATRSTRR